MLYCFIALLLYCFIALLLYCFIALLLFASAAVHADNSGISIGLGHPYGSKLGVKYSIGEHNTKYYVGAGILRRSSSGGTTLGYSLGFDQKVINDNHSLGASLGTVDSTINLSNSKTYAHVGAAINYSYYFAGFNNQSWVIGGSFYAGKRDLPGTEYDSNINGFSLNGGYTF